MTGELFDYYAFASKGRLDKSLSTLVGLLEGIGIDGHVNETEVKYLSYWLGKHTEFRHRHPFSELVPAIEEALEDGVLTEEERLDLLWLCKQIWSSAYYDEVTSELQKLHAVTAAIAADGIVTTEELRGLRDWLDEREQLKCLWPYEEVNSIVTSTLAKGEVDEKSSRFLVALFKGFSTDFDPSKSNVRSEEFPLNVQSLCAIQPEIIFDGRSFCFSGEPKSTTKSELERIVAELGGVVKASPSKKLDFLVVGANGNPCWAFARYGRKIETAMNLRKAGAKLLIVHENDFHDAVADFG